MSNPNVRIFAESTLHDIAAVSTGSRTFSILNDWRTSFPDGCTLRVNASTGNDRAYTVSGTPAFSIGYTVITVAEAIPSATADGTLHAQDYIDLEFCEPRVRDSNPIQVVKGRRGTKTAIIPPGDGGAQWANELLLVFPFEYIYDLNYSGAPVSRHLYAWLRHYVRDGLSRLTVYLSGGGYDRDGNQVVIQDYYAGRFQPPLPDVLNGNHVVRAGGGAEYLTLTLIVDDEGTWTDIDDDLSITTRGARP